MKLIKLRIKMTLKIKYFIQINKMLTLKTVV
jgi:hypothetical protein